MSCTHFDPDHVFFFHDTATTEIYTLSLHDALPNSRNSVPLSTGPAVSSRAVNEWASGRSEEHTSELQSRFDLVCRLLLEKKKKQPFDLVRQTVIILQLILYLESSTWCLVAGHLVSK